MHSNGCSSGTVDSRVGLGFLEPRPEPQVRPGRDSWQVFGLNLLVIVLSPTACINGPRCTVGLGRVSGWISTIS